MLHVHRTVFIEHLSRPIAPELPMIILSINGVDHAIDVEPDTPLLFVLRDELGLTGTKYGCGVGACRACTIHVDGEPTCACLVPVETVGAKRILTIEGLAASVGLASGELHPVQKAWISAQVPQCGYCQSGMIMAAASLLKSNPTPTDADIDAAITNLCRCGTYPRIRRALRSLGEQASR
jgi:isoquinoline 1-oxidoreductase subunit alpha